MSNGATPSPVASSSDASTARSPARSPAARPRRAPVLAFIGAVLVGAILLDQSSALSSRSTASPAPAVSAEPAVPAAAAVSTSWFCAEGTSNQGGRADETILVASIADHRLEATVTVMTGGDNQPVSRRVSVAARALVSVPVSSITANSEPGVVVEVAGGQAIVSHQLVGEGDVAVEPCARAASVDWYFANGTTVRGAQQFIVLFNPFGDDAIVDLTFLTDAGVMEPDQMQAVVVPRRSRVSLPVHAAVERQVLIAAHVHARVGRVVAERSQLFDGSTSEGVPLRKGLAVSLGATSPRGEWQLAYGDAADGQVQTVAIANFGVQKTAVEIHVNTDGDLTIPPSSTEVPGESVVTVDVAKVAPATGHYTVTVVARDAEGANPPVVAEMLAAWPPSAGTRSVATALGTTRRARRWVVAVPDLGGSVREANVTVVNPGAKPTTAALVVMEAGDTRGPVSEPEVAIPAASFGQLSVARAGGRVVVVHADRPVVVSLSLVGGQGATASPAVPDQSPGG